MTRSSHGCHAGIRTRAMRPEALARAMRPETLAMRILGLGLLLLLDACAHPPSIYGPWAFDDVRVFDGKTLLEHQSVVVQEGKITALGPKGSVSFPREATIYRDADYTLLPGFIDSHVHLGFYDPVTVLRGGITTARDLGWPARDIFPLATSLAAAPTAGPYLLPAGPMLTAPGGYPTDAGWAPDGTGLEVASPEAATAAVKSLVAQGAKHIKVAQQADGATLSLEVLKAIVTEAHASGLRVTSHCSSFDQLDLALNAGVDELAHGLWSGASIPDETLSRMAAAGMTMVPTLHVASSSERVDNVRRYLKLGGKVIYGTDMGNAGPPPGIDVVELSLMVQAGMSNAQALNAATASAAQVHGLSTRGRVALGMTADLVLVRGNPVASLEVLLTPVLVLREGIAAK